jgi:hypothetical protein
MGAEKPGTRHTALRGRDTPRSKRGRPRDENVGYAGSNGGYHQYGLHHALSISGLRQPNLSSGVSADRNPK